MVERLKEAIAGSPELGELLGKIEVKIDPDGITLEIMDTEQASMFAPASTKILPKAEKAFSQLVNLLSPLPFPIEVIGHTDATPFSSFPSPVSNWDLSALRANEARKVLQSHGFPANRVLAVIGKADKDLRFPERPFDAGNRRITVRLKFNDGRTNGPIANKDLFENPFNESVNSRTEIVRTNVEPTKANLSVPLSISGAEKTESRKKVSSRVFGEPTASRVKIPRKINTVIPTRSSTSRSSRETQTYSPPTRRPTRAPELEKFPVLRPGQLAEELVKKQ
jgi:outer membrane protein OmpA-like peptidoglycan-associated protein